MSCAQREVALANLQTAQIVLLPLSELDPV